MYSLRLPKSIGISFLLCACLTGSAAFPSGRAVLEVAGSAAARRKRSGPGISLLGDRSQVSGMLYGNVDQL
jgi:hypothetical protein